MARGKAKSAVSKMSAVRPQRVPRPERVRVRKVAVAAAADVTGSKKEGQTAAPVQETLLKRRKRIVQNDEWVAKRAALNKRRDRKKGGVRFNRVEHYIREYRKMSKLNVPRILNAKPKGAKPTEENRLVFVLFIKSPCGMPPKRAKILELLRLRTTNTGVFIKTNKAIINMLKIVEPLVTWGYPDLKTVRDLVYKHGFGKVGREKVALTDNAVIEKVIGHENIICIEDLVHEIFTGERGFKQATNFLWPFRLHNPTGGWSVKNAHFTDGGNYGFRDHQINDLLRKMI